MGLFRRPKPLHQRLAEEGGLVEPARRPPFTGVIGETGIHGVPREREYDAVVTADAPDVEGTSARFVGLEDGSLLIEEGDGDLTPLADSISGNFVMSAASLPLIGLGGPNPPPLVMM